MLPEYIVSAFLFVFGAVWGSFLNVCIYRIPEGLSIVNPPSHCFNCDEKIKPYDNIPILSYLILGGKCRNCKVSYSPRYALVELFTALITVALFYRFGLTIDLAMLIIFVYALIVITFIDIDHKIIPNAISLPGIPLGLAAAYFAGYVTFKNALLGMTVGLVFLLFIALFYFVVYKREGMGGGDIKLIAMIGAWLGVEAVGLTIFSASVVGSVVGLFIMIRFGKDPKYAIPFGPFLALGAVTHIFFGKEILEWYFDLVL